MYQLSLIPLLVCTVMITSAAQEQPVSIGSMGVCSFCSVYSRLYGCWWLEPRPGKDVALPAETLDDTLQHRNPISKTYDAQQLLGGE